MAECSSKQVRVMLWSPPRCLSTVFEKCLSYVDNIQIVNEAYQCAGIHSPEMNQNLEFLDNMKQFFAEAEHVQLTGNIKEVGWDTQICTISWVKHLLESDFPGKNVVFAKDLISGINNQFHMIPKGYRHTFIIRNPTKMFISQRKNMSKIMGLPEDKINLMTLPAILREWYKPMLQFVEYIKENEVETEPVIIDADDLQDHPGSIVRQYCEAVGIPYKESLLEWPAGDECVKNNWLVSKLFLQGDQLMGYYAAAFASTQFKPSNPLPPENEIPGDVLKASKMAEPYYKQLYDMRIKP